MVRPSERNGEVTYNEILNKAYARGDNCAEVALGRMMDEVELDTGRFPDWNDEAPEWVLEVAGLLRE